MVFLKHSEDTENGSKCEPYPGIHSADPYWGPNLCLAVEVQCSKDKTWSQEIYIPREEKDDPQKDYAT